MPPVAGGAKRQGPPVRKKTEIKTARKRQAIVAAALDEFARKGFAQARIEDVARRAKVGKGTVYLYFKDKNALFEGLVRDLIVPPLAGVRDAEPGPGESVGAFLRRVLPPAVAMVAGSRRGDVVRLLIGEGVRFPALADSYRRTVIEPLIGRLRALLLRAREQGELRSGALIQFPQLLVAPAVVAIIWNRLFGKALPLDTQAMLQAHLDLIFQKPAS